MTGYLITISNALADGLQATFCLLLICLLSSRQRPGGRWVAAAFTGGSLTALFARFIGLPDSWLSALAVLLITACAVLGQRSDTRKSLFLAIFYEIAVSFWRFLLGAWLGVLFHSPAFLDSGSEPGQLSLWLLAVLTAALAVYLASRHEITQKSALHLASAIVLAGFFGIITLSEQSSLSIPDDTLYQWIILSIILTMAVLVFYMSRQYEVEKDLAKLKSQQAELLERDYTTLNNAYQINAKLFHDVHNHIGVLRRLLSHERYEEALEYLDELQAPVREMADTVWTGDETADYLINSTAAAARAAQISFEAMVEFPRGTNIRGADLCAVLGNLLDNALEAARQVPDPGQRFIRLTIRRINQMLVIKVENRVLRPPVWERGQLKTSKEDNRLHGWGMKSAAAAAEKYDGTVQCSCENHIFRAVATLSYQSASNKERSR